MSTYFTGGKMLKELEELGLLKKENGSIDEKTKIMLLHIYKSRFEKKKTDVAGVLHDIKANQLNSYSQLFDSQIKDFFVDGFESGIELMHSALCERGKASDEQMKVKQYRAFADASDNMLTLAKLKNEYGDVCQSNEELALKYLPTATRYILNKEIIFGEKASQISVGGGAQ